MGIATARVEGYTEDVLLVKVLDGSTPTPGGATAVGGNVAVGATDTGNPVKIGGLATSAPPATATNGTRVDAWFNSRGALVVAGLTSAGADGQNNSVLASMTLSNGGAGLLPTVGMVFNGTTWDRQRGDVTGTHVVQKPAIAGGTSTAKIISAATTNATLVKASAGQIYGGQFSNTGAAWAYVKLYNKATAPTPGTDTPIDIIGVPPGGHCQINRPIGTPHAAGISIAITGGSADADTTAVTAGQVVGSIQFM